MLFTFTSFPYRTWISVPNTASCLTCLLCDTWFWEAVKALPTYYFGQRNAIRKGDCNQIGGQKNIDQQHSKCQNLFLATKADILITGFWREKLKQKVDLLIKDFLVNTIFAKIGQKVAVFLMWLLSYSMIVFNFLQFRRSERKRKRICSEQYKWELEKQQLYTD